MEKLVSLFTLGSTLLAGRLRPLSVIFGYIPYFMATEIPYIDWITFIVFNTIGIGLCILTNPIWSVQSKSGKNQ